MGGPLAKELLLPVLVSKIKSPTDFSPLMPPLIGNSLPNYRARLHEVCQKNSYVLKPEYVEDHSTGKPTFKCTMTCLLQGRKIVEDSGRYYYPRKDDAKEIVAKKILGKMQSMQSSQCRGVSNMSAAVIAPVGTPSNMIWKSRLKEYYDKQGKPGMEIKYTATSLGQDGFVATVFTPELGPAGIVGECGKSKKEAEQNAAKKAMEYLKQR